MSEQTQQKEMSKKQLVKIGSLLLLAVLIFKLAAGIMCINLAIFLSSKDSLYHANTLDKLPFNEYGLLLGTSERVKGGKPNPHFWNRIDAAALLYSKGKIKKIIASGDPRPGRQNEVKAMQRALLTKGVSAKDIILDNEGLRTFSSIIRARNHFGLTNVTIISQEYHNYRAVYLAKFLNLKPVAYCAETPPLNKSFFVNIREIGARIKAVIDIFNYAMRDNGNQPQKG